MIDKLKNIELGQGLGIIKFGLNRDQVKDILGEPDETEQFTYGEGADDLTESWHYDEFEFSLSFDKETDWKLSGIAVSSPDFLLFGKEYIGIEREELMEAIKGQDFGEMELEELSIEEDIGHSVLSYDKVSLNFWFENDELTEIQWGPFWGEDNTPLWPEIR